MAIKFELYTGRKSGVRRPSQDANTAYLKASDWDDYGFKTQFALVVFDKHGQKHSIGAVKIGFRGFKTGWASDYIDAKFTALDEGFFSLGQHEEYYSNIQNLPPELRDNILLSLRDLVHDEKLKIKASEEKVFKTSLLRNVSLKSVLGQYRRILQGGAIQTEFHFKFEIPKGKKTAGMELEFHVIPESNPPTNIHVLIGSNGVGKTILLNNMVKSLASEEHKSDKFGRFSTFGNDWNNQDPEDESEQIFSGVISVAFSAFDNFEPLPEKRDKSSGVRYSYVGLKRTTNIGGDRGTPMSWKMLTTDFVKSLNSTISKGNMEIWNEAITTLESDPLFRSIHFKKNLNDFTNQELTAYAGNIFRNLSSGHAIVLLAITKLVEKLEEKTLVLFDEPESHLHPPLLSAFIRALSELLAHRNGVAVIATHSPVILQEVPAQCVYKLNRSGLNAKLERPLIETFGENVGVLTREIFGLEVSEAGYHKLLERELENTKSYDKIIELFDEQLGSEAKGILRSLILTKKNELED